MCTIILSFVLVFNDGHREARQKWVDKDVANMFIQFFHDKDWVSELDAPKCCRAIENIETKTVKAFDCVKGPKNDR